MKIYEKIVKFIKEYYKILILYVCLFLFFTLKLPYYIESPGGLIDISKKIIVSDSYKFSGSLNMAYVSEMHATIPTFLFSKINSDWNLIKQQEMTSSNEKIEDSEYRNKMFLRESYDVAKLVAYSHSKIDYEVKNRKVYVTYIDEKSKTDLKIGDQIIEVDEKKVLDKNHLQAYIASKNIDDEVVFTVNRKNKMLKVKTNLIDVNGEPKVGAIITEDFDILSSMLLRCMQKAEYRSENLGHYGLASRCYTHFTSPIRRFPDTTLHTLLRKYLFNEPSPNELNKLIDEYESKLPEICAHSSLKERNAIECERDVDDMKMAEYMEDHIGEEFEGVIDGIMNFGMFIQLPNLIEGLVKVESIKDDYYFFDEELNMLIGKNSKKKFRLGDKVKVKVIAASKDTSTIGFVLVG